MGTNILVAA